MRTKNLLKYFLQLFLPTSIVFGLSIAYLYSSEVKKERAVREANEVLHINLGKQAIEKDIEAAVSDLRVISQHREFEYIDTSLSSEVMEPLAQEFLGFSKSKRLYDQLRFLDEAGKEVIRINFSSGKPYIVPEGQLQDKRKRYFFKDAMRLKVGEILISNFDLNIEHKKIAMPVKSVVRLMTPVHYGQGKNKGVIVLNYKGSILIQDFKKTTADIADHSMILDVDGFWLYDPRTGLEWGSQLGHGFTFKKQFSRAWERITKTSRGHFYNDKGLFTFATVYPVRLVRESNTEATVANDASSSEANGKEYYWKAVAHVNSGVLDAAASAIAMRQAPISVLLFGLLVTGCWLQARTRVRRLEMEEAMTIRAGQQAAVAELGQRALSGVGLGALMDTIVEYVAQVLKVEYCKILELLPDGEAFLLCAGTGWRQGLIGQATVGAGMDSQAGYTLICKDPIIVADLRQEKRFTGSQLLHDHSVVSGLSVIIHGVNRPFGVLGVHKTKRRTFTKDDMHFLQAVANIISEVIELESAQDKTRLQTSALTAAADGIVIADLEGNIQWVNPACTRLTGHELDEVLGKNMRILKSGKQDPAFYKKMWDTILAGKTWHGSLWNKRKDGSLYLEEESITPVFDKTGEVHHFIAIKRDISERQQLQRQLQQSQKMEAIGQLTGGMAHDFNNILTSILGYTELAHDELTQVDNEKIGNYLDQVYKSGRRARDLVAQMLAFSRGGEGKLNSLLISPLIKESLKMLGSTLPSTVEINLQLESDDLVIMTNPVQIHQLIMNLLINARDAMDGKGHITIGCRCVKSDDIECYSCHKNFKGDHIEIFVRDTGSGIQPQQLEHIFEPFYTTKEVGKGTGMGLSMVHGIMHDHGGHIVVETVPGKGTTFALLFPVIDSQVKTDDKQDSEPNEKLDHPIDGNILIVDDEVSVGGFIGELLKGHGCNVTVETDSQSALSKFRENPQVFDLVVTDQTMPGMTGTELAQSLMGIRPDLPVILCTGYSEQIDEVGARAVGIRGYLNKPIETDKFLRMVNNLLGPKGIK